MKRTVIIFDTETTGLPLPSSAPLEKQPRIIEFGAVKIDLESSDELGFISQLIDPGVEISEEITKITGIKNEDLVGQPKFEELLPTFVEFFKGADVLIAHNAPFDTKMLKNELRRANCENFPWPAETVCSVQEYRHVFGHRPKLTELYERIIGEPLMQTHRAIDDVRALTAALTKDGFFEILD